jgi:hypothetical protein
MTFHGAFKVKADAERRARSRGGVVRRYKLRRLGVRYVVMKGR